MGSDIEGEVAEEEADEAEEYSKNLGIKQVFKERLLEIKNALDKIERGEQLIIKKNNDYGNN